MKIVLNRCDGYFELSYKAVNYLINRSIIKILKNSRDLPPGDELWAIIYRIPGFVGIEVSTNAAKYRTDERIIEVVEKLGYEASGRKSRLEVFDIDVEIPYYVAAVDGGEEIWSKSRYNEFIKEWRESCQN